MNLVAGFFDEKVVKTIQKQWFLQFSIIFANGFFGVLLWVWRAFWKCLLGIFAKRVRAVLEMAKAPFRKTGTPEFGIAL